MTPQTLRRLKLIYTVHENSVCNSQGIDVLPLERPIGKCRMLK